MPRFSVMVGFHTSQVIEVEGDTLDQALEHAIGDTDLPNASNEFELSGDPEAIVTYDESGALVYTALNG